MNVVTTLNNTKAALHPQHARAEGAPAATPATPDEEEVKLHPSGY
jgi:hypothetical protein